MEQDRHAEVLRTLGAFLVTEQSLGDTLLSVARLSLQVVPEAVFAGMLLADERQRPATWVFTDEEAPEIDEAQYRPDRGPCLASWRSGQIVRVPDTEDAEARNLFPEFVEACANHGVRSTLSMPLMS